MTQKSEYFLNQRWNKLEIAYHNIGVKKCYQEANNKNSNPKH